MSLDALRERSELANGVEYEVDCIIFGAGFEVGTSYSQRCGYETYGRGGVSLTENWKDDMRAFHGLHSHSSPNLFFMGTNGSLRFTANYPHALNEQSKHISWISAQCEQGNHKIVEATEEAGNAWVQTIVPLGRLRRQPRLDGRPACSCRSTAPATRSPIDRRREAIAIWRSLLQRCALAS